jgi:transcriptional regulator with XRE-family HTH domain
MNWPELIRTARLRLGESQVQFAKRFAVAPNTVSRWENGTYEVSLAAVEWLLTYSMGVTITICPKCKGIGITKKAETKQ